MSRSVSKLALVIALSLAPSACTAFKNPFSKKKYTPLVFFKVPPGLIPECDAMEAEVASVEKELGVRVERLDVLRDPSAEAALALLTQRTPPFLYHRESCQTMHITPKRGDGEAKADMPDVIDRERIRAWAKGRFLPTLTQQSVEGSRVKTPVVVSQKDSSMDQDELLEDMALTPLQRKGKERMKERTEARAQK